MDPVVRPPKQHAPRPRHRAALTVCVAVIIAMALQSVPGTLAAARHLITGRDIKNSSLTTVDIRNRSLRAVDFKAGDLPAGKNGADGSALYKTVIVVHPGSTAAAGGANLIAAMTKANSVTSGSVVVYVEVGDYDIGTTPLTATGRVLLVGADRHFTFVSGAPSTGCMVSGTTDFRVSHITLTAQGCVFRAASANDSTFVDDVDMSATIAGVGVQHEAGSLLMRDSGISVNGSNAVAFQQTGFNVSTSFEDVTVTASGSLAAGVRANSTGSTLSWRGGSVDAPNTGLFVGSAINATVEDVNFTGGPSVTANGAGTTIQLVRGRLAGTATASSSGDLSCAQVLRALGDAPTTAVSNTCA